MLQDICQQWSPGSALISQEDGAACRTGRNFARTASRSPFHFYLFCGGLPNPVAGGLIVPPSNAVMMSCPANRTATGAEPLLLPPISPIAVNSTGKWAGRRRFRYTPLAHACADTSARLPEAEHQSRPSSTNTTARSVQRKSSSGYGDVNAVNITGTPRRRRCSDPAAEMHASGVVLLIGIHSSPTRKSQRRREAIRASWLRWESVGRSVLCCFLVGGRGLSRQDSRFLETEAREYGDVLLLEDVADRCALTISKTVAWWRAAAQLISVGGRSISHVVRRALPVHAMRGP